MKKELKKNLTYKKSMLIFTILCIISGLSSFLISDAATPFAAAFFAAILLFETDGEHKFSRFTLAALVIINACAFFVPGFIPSLWSVSAIALAFIMKRAYLRETPKVEAAFTMTLVVVAAVVLSAIMLPMIAYARADFAVVLEFYSSIIEAIKSELVNAYELLISQMPSGASGSMISVEQFIGLFNHQVSMIISYVVIFGFLIVGASFKLFGLIVSKNAENSAPLYTWRFTTSNTFAYFYIVLAIVTVFIADLGSLFAVTAYNLFNIFAIIYFYVGFNVAVGFLAKKRGHVRAFLLVGVLVVLFFTYAIEILALIGAFNTIRKNATLPRSE